jgi:hypothetical protein
VGKGRQIYTDCSFLQPHDKCSLPILWNGFFWAGVPRDYYSLIQGSPYSRNDGCGCHCEVTPLSEYYALSDQLREKGFAEDVGEDAPLCRWVVEDVILDVMPN